MKSSSSPKKRKKNFDHKHGAFLTLIKIPKIPQNLTLIHFTFHVWFFDFFATFLFFHRLKQSL